MHLDIWVNAFWLLSSGPNIPNLWKPKTLLLPILYGHPTTKNLRKNDGVSRLLQPVLSMLGKAAVPTSDIWTVIRIIARNCTIKIYLMYNIIYIYIFILHTNTTEHPVVVLNIVYMRLAMDACRPTNRWPKGMHFMTFLMAWEPVFDDSIPNYQQWVSSSFRYRNIFKKKTNRSQLFQGWVSFFAAEMHQQIHPKVRGWPFKSRRPETVSAALLQHCSAGGWAAPPWCCDSWGRSNEARWKRGGARRTNMLGTLW